MKNKQTHILEVPSEHFHVLLETLVNIRIKRKSIIPDTDPINCIDIGNGIEVVAEAKYLVKLLYS